MIEIWDTFHQNHIKYKLNILSKFDVKIFYVQEFFAFSDKHEKLHSFPSFRLLYTTRLVRLWHKIIYTLTVTSQKIHLNDIKNFRKIPVNVVPNISSRPVSLTVFTGAVRRKNSVNNVKVRNKSIKSLFQSTFRQKYLTAESSFHIIIKHRIYLNIFFCFVSYRRLEPSIRKIQ